MAFFDKYARLCRDRGMRPMSQEAADLCGVKRAAITYWKKSGMLPKGETLVRIADGLGVSADYLLGRTDDPEDYARAGTDRGAAPARALSLYARLDGMDRARAEAFMEGILSTEKYRAGGDQPGV